MQDARVYLGLVRERGKKGLPLKRVYRQLYNRDLYLIAYGRIYRNTGATTQGTTQETVDAMSLAKIDAIINALRQERYRLLRAELLRSLAWLSSTTRMPYSSQGHL